MRATRWILIALVTAAAVVAGGAWLVTALVDAGRFRPQIQAAVESATGRALRIDGDVSLDLFPWVAISVTDAALANPAGFASAELARWRELSLGARLWPLLRGQLELSRIRIDGARITLERRADGVANWDGVGEPRAAGVDAASRGAVLRSLAGIELRDGRVDYVDHVAGTRLALDGLAVTLPRWSPGDALPVRASGNATFGAQPAWPFALSTTLSLADQATTLADLRLSLRVKAAPAARGLALAVSAPTIELIHEPLVVRGAAIAARIGAAADRLSIRDWRYVAGGPQSAAAAEVELQLASLRTTLLDAGVTPPYTTDPAALGALRLVTTARLADGQWRLAPLALALDATTLRGQVLRGADGILDVTLAGDRIDLGRYLEPDDAQTRPFRFPTQALRALEARALVTLERATLADAELEGVTLRLVHDAAGLRRDAGPIATPVAP